MQVNYHHNFFERGQKNKFLKKERSRNKFLCFASSKTYKTIIGMRLFTHNG